MSLSYVHCILSISSTHLPVGRWRFRFPMASLEMFTVIILTVAICLWGRPASNTKESQEYFLRGKGGRFLGLTTLPPSCEDCLEIWEPQIPGSVREYPRIALPVPIFLSTSRCPLHISYQLIVVKVQSEQLSGFWRNLFNLFTCCDKRLPSSQTDKVYFILSYKYEGHKK